MNMRSLFVLIVLFAIDCSAVEIDNNGATITAPEVFVEHKINLTGTPLVTLTDRNQFRRAMAVQPEIKNSGDDMLRLAHIHNTIVALDSSFDDMPSEYVMESFFGKPTTLEEAEKYFEAVDAITKDGDVKALRDFISLPWDEQCKAISKYRSQQAELLEHQKRVELAKHITIGVFAAILIGILMYVFYKIFTKSAFHRLFLITTLLLALALSDMPDGYYAILRVAVCGVCVYSAVKFKLEWARWIFGALAVLYNPVLPVHLDDKDLWSFLNVITTAYIWIALYLENRPKRPVK